MKGLEERVAKAVRFFWATRQRQQTKQGSATGKRDQGGRSAVTGGAQLGGFITLVREMLLEHGIPDSAVHKKRTDLPGFFRPTKEWDLVVIVKEHLLASMEFKSQVGPSFGNNYNNRTEEAIGSATDLWTAYRDGAFRESPRPWLGYFMLLEEAPQSTRPVAVSESHFPVFEEFRDASYARRYELFCHKLVRERMYDAACFLLSDQAGGRKGKFLEPSHELTFKTFIASLLGQAIAWVKLYDL
jgi:hypothetical protein